MLQALTWNTRAFAAAYLAEDEACVTNATRARAICERLGIYSHRAVAEQALGMLALGRRSCDTAIEHLERGRESRLRYGVRDPGYMFNESDLTEAYIRAGRPADAERSLAELRAGAPATEGAWAAAAVARYAALLGDDAEVDSYPGGGERRPRAGRLRLRGGAHEADLRRTAPAGAAARSRAAPADGGGGGLPRAGRGPLGRSRRRRELRAGGLLASAPSTRRARLDGDGLTEREREVCALVVAGSSNAQVAAALFISPRTVEHHLHSIYRKVGVRSRAQLAARVGAAAPKTSVSPDAG